MSAYYNENDSQKAACLKEFMRANLIAPGEVDERSIADVEAADLRDFTQCHFFAGFGVWSYALRLAGWPDDRPVWTGSCPCPSFSAAGKGKGFDDPRHLWPAWSRLIAQCGPATVFGEQADDAVGFGWLDLVQTDLERENYAVGKAVLGACSVGAPHIRQRLYFGASQLRSESARGGCAPGRTGEALSGEESRRKIERSGLLVDGADSLHSKRRPINGPRQDGRDRENTGREEAHGQFGAHGEARNSSDSHGRLPSHRELQRSGEQRLLAEDSGTGNGKHADSSRTGTQTGDHRETGEEEARGARSDDSSNLSLRTSSTIDSSNPSQRGLPMHGSAPGNGGHLAFADESGISSQPLSPRLEGYFGDVRDWRGPGWLDPHTARSVAEAGATRGFWADCDWWHARDEKYRPIEPGLSPLAHGASNRVLKLRGYGDAICPQVAAEFIVALN